MEITFSVKDFLEMVNEPEFSIGSAKELNDDITYRKINDWESKGLISAYRKTEATGWRKFTFIDMIKLFIISDLKKFGLDSPSIERALKNLEKYDVEKIIKNTELEELNKGLTLSVYELVSYLTTCGCKATLFITNQDSVKIVFELANAALPKVFEKILQDPKEIMNELSRTPSIILPLTSHIKKVFSLYESDTRPANPNPTLPSPDAPLKDVAAYIEGFNEKRILECIKNRNYEEITIVKSNGEITKIRAKSKTSKIISDGAILQAIHERDFQRITTITKNGQVIALVREEDIKI